MESSSAQLSSQIPATPETYGSEMQKLKELQYVLGCSKRALARYSDHPSLKFPVRIALIQKALVAIKEDVSLFRNRESDDVDWGNFIYENQSISWSLDILFDNISFGQPRKHGHNLSYGGGVNFARYKRPEISKYKALKPNNSYNFSYNDKYSAYSNRSHRKLDDKPSSRLSAHNKNLSHGNILDVKSLDRKEPEPISNVSPNKDANENYGYDAYKSYDHTVKPQNDRFDLGSRNSRGSQQADDKRASRTKLNHTISYDHPDDKVLQQMPAPHRSESPTMSQRNLPKYSGVHGSIQDSLEDHIYRARTGVSARDLNSRVAQKDVERQSIEQDRYYSRLNKMNSKQAQIFEKYLVDQLVPAKDKEKHLEQIEKQKREEAKERLDLLDKGSKHHQTALKREYRKYLNNQMDLRRKEKDYQSQVKKEDLVQMKNFAALEQQKDKQEKLGKLEMKHAYRSALQSQEYLKSKQKLNDQTKLHQYTHGGSPDAVYTFGGTFTNTGNQQIEKGYIQPNPIVNPVSDPMYNPYFRRDILSGMNEIQRNPQH